MDKRATLRNYGPMARKPVNEGSRMNRRTWLQLMAGLAAGTAVGANAPRPLRIVVAGAGIVGASIAYHLARAGAAVTVIDKQAPAAHASRGTFAWINATWAKQPRSHHALNQASVVRWQSLQQQLRLPVRWGGSLEWYAEADASSSWWRRLRSSASGENARAWCRRPNSRRSSRR